MVKIKLLRSKIRYTLLDNDGNEVTSTYQLMPLDGTTEIGTYQLIQLLVKSLSHRLINYTQV